MRGWKIVLFGAALALFSSAYADGDRYGKHPLSITSDQIIHKDPAVKPMAEAIRAYFQSGKNADADSMAIRIMGTLDHQPQQYADSVRLVGVLALEEHEPELGNALAERLSVHWSKHIPARKYFISRSGDTVVFGGIGAAVGALAGVFLVGLPASLAEPEGTVVATVARPAVGGSLLGAALGAALGFAGPATIIESPQRILAAFEIGPSTTTSLDAQTVLVVPKHIR